MPGPLLLHADLPRYKLQILCDVFFHGAGLPEAPGGFRPCWERCWKRKSWDVVAEMGGSCLHNCYTNFVSLKWYLADSLANMYLWHLWSDFAGYRKWEGKSGKCDWSRSRVNSWLNSLRSWVFILIFWRKGPRVDILTQLGSWLCIRWSGMKRVRQPGGSGRV